MTQATLELNDTNFKKYLNIELNWNQIPAIRMWLKLRQFDVDRPILTSRNITTNTLTFYQAPINACSTIVVVHLDLKINEQLTNIFRNLGHAVYSFTNISSSNLFLFQMTENKTPIDLIILQESIKISPMLKYQSYLQNTFPKIKTITVRGSSINDKINLNLSKREYIKALLNQDRQNKPTSLRMSNFLKKLKRNKYKSQQFNMKFIQTYSYLFDTLFTSRDKVDKKQVWNELKLRAKIHNHVLNLNTTVTLWKEYNYAK